MQIARFPFRLAPLYGLIIALLPPVAALQEFWWHLHPLLVAALGWILLTMVYYAVREYQQEVATGGHEGGHGRKYSAHLVMVTVFALACFWAWPLLNTVALGHAAWNLPEILPRANATVVDVTVYATAAILLVAIYWLAHRFPGVKFDFYLRWRFNFWDLLIILGLSLLTVGVLLGYMHFFAGTHQPMSVFGVQTGATAPWQFWLAGIAFALANALIEEFWFRGLLMGALKPLLPMWRVVLIQAFVFGVFHWFGTPHGVLGVLLAGAWGLLLGIWVYRRGSLWPALIVHFIADLVIFITTN